VTADLGEDRLLIGGGLIAAEGGRICPNVNSVNGGNDAADSPFGGYKSSVIGRQGGLDGPLQFVETQTIALPVR